MSHKAGLHRKVSSIFGKTSLPDSLSASPTDKNVASVDNVQTSDSHFAGQTFTPDETQTVAKVDDGLTEEERQFAASQSKKLFLVIGLSVVFALVLYFFYWPGHKKDSAGNTGTSHAGAAAQKTEINWPEPQPWPANVRDPMVLGSSPVSAGEGFGLKGIVYLPQGRSSVLIGTEIYYEGDAVKDTDWKVAKISLDSVKLQNAHGEEKNITMEGR
jgi:hypothetical protein